MKNLRACLVNFGLALVVALLFPTGLLAWPGTVVSVIDGDTVTVAPAGDRKTPVRVRLYGVDTPEAAQPFGPEATAWLRTALPVGTPVEIVHYYSDKYGRTVAVVQVGDRILNSELVTAGLAWVYHPYCKARFCRDWNRAQKKAKADRRGLWRANEKPMHPAAWRKAHSKAHEAD